MLDDWMGTVNEVLAAIRADQRRARRQLYKRPVMARQYGGKTQHKAYRQIKINRLSV